ncbi:MAG: DUF4340 domain-containing protein [Rhodobacterales bacterium]|nr:DUF4340 domain-containing protein [Rhodobacterales bacterium]
MQDSQLRGLIGLSLVVVILVGLLSLPDDQESAHGDDATQVLNLPGISAVVEIKLVRPDDTVKLSLDESEWTVVSPYHAAADQAVVDRVLDGLREIAWGAPFEADGNELSDFGLGDPPAVQVTLKMADGTEQSVTLGTPSPVGWQTYVQLPSNELAVVPGRPGDLLADSAETFRDRRLLRFSPGDVRGVRIVGTQGVLSVQGQGTHWFIEGYTRAEADLVDDLVLGLLDLRFDRNLGLDNKLVEPRYRVTVSLEGAVPQEFLVGDTTPMGVIVQGPSASGVVFPESLALITQGPVDLGTANVLGLRPERDDRIEVELEGTSWSANRTDTGWSIDGVPDGVALQKVLALSELQIVYQREQAPELTEVLATLRVVRNGQTRAVQIGQTIGDELHTAIDVDGGAPFRVRATQLTALQPPATQ